MCTSIEEVQPEKGIIGAGPRFVSLCMERRNNNGVHVFGFHTVINWLVGQKIEVEFVVTSTKHGYEPLVILQCNVLSNLKYNFNEISPKQNQNNNGSSPRNAQGSQLVEAERHVIGGSKIANFNVDYNFNSSFNFTP
ncbi:LOW QUALITY PROTEIN: uncharacterized protein TERG_01899 [Trichophyton rubrum CBS 118892]|uniref:Uncharacterized protein n=1 Tax=Trichophyton rubrum (strain ATCC MYA-4607 / CBS 118892) TaxID=559305 RepID=F2SIM9_TRIRC|nr:LOW QUALITY PROTEIN: uncharacterized protein TERG_01899 [Trichophyton rubrum CBS 118892]EGD85628.2 LOW QUALITY PROTEIN: hypothetical protein TERG_01899 [Trichophyton rubrum CBS 118892]